MRVSHYKPRKDRALSNETVLRIRNLRFKENLSFEKISSQLKISPGIIRDICNWETYRDVG